MRRCSETRGRDLLSELFLIIWQDHISPFKLYFACPCYTRSKSHCPFITRSLDCPAHKGKVNSLTLRSPSSPDSLQKSLQDGYRGQGRRGRTGQLGSKRGGPCLWRGNTSQPSCHQGSKKTDGNCCSNWLKLNLKLNLSAVDTIHRAQGGLAEKHPEHDLWESSQGATWQLQAVVQLSQG